MKFKSKILTVCLATSALLVPVQKAFGAGTTNQVKEEKIQHLVCVKETQYSLRCQVENSQQPKAITNSKSALAKPPAQNSTKQSSVAQVSQHITFNGIEVFLLLTCVGSISTGLFLYIQHRNNRATVLAQNVETLERLWRISNYQRE